MGSVMSGARAWFVRTAEQAWGRDREALGAWPAFLNRTVRLATWTVRGAAVDRLPRQAAALTYYTVFSIVPLLVVALWALKSSGYLDRLTATLLDASTGPLAGNPPLLSVARQIVSAVDHRFRTTSGLVGLAALLYAAFRLLANVGSVLDSIAGARRRRLRARRLSSYLALLLLPALGATALSLLLAIGGKRGALMPASPYLRLAIGVLGAFSGGWLALVVLYVGAGRASIGFASAAFGAAFGAIALGVVLWVFVRFQIGAGKASGLQSGLAAGPVFLLWLWASWCVLLIGAEVAFGYHVDCVVGHGARGWRLDADGEQAAGLAIMVRLARGALGGGVWLTVPSLAHELRLFPHAVQRLCRALARAGLLAERNGQGYTIDCDPDRATAAVIAGALARDRSLDEARDQILAALDPPARAALSAIAGAREAAGCDLTLRQLAQGEPLA